MAKRIYCFVMDDCIRAEIDLGNYALAAMALKDAASVDVGRGDLDMILLGDPDTTVAVSQVIFDAAKTYICR